MSKEQKEYTDKIAKERSDLLAKLTLAQLKQMAVDQLILRGQLHGLVDHDLTVAITEKMQSEVKSK